MKPIRSTLLALALLLAVAGPALAQPNTPAPAPISIAPAPLHDTIYVVQSGDNLFRIGLRFGVSVAALKAANGLTSNLIYVGQRLVIPGPGGSTAGATAGTTTTTTTTTTTATVYVVRAGDNLFRIGLKFGVSVAALKAANGLTSNLIYVGQQLKIPGAVSSAPATSAPLAPTATRAPGVPSPTLAPPTATRVPPTATANPGVYTSSRGVRGEYFRLRNNTAGVNGDIWFEFAVTNTTDSAQYVGGLGAIIPGVWSQASWGDFTLGAHQYLDPEDHLNVPRAGTYTVYLGICWLASRSACEANLNSWDLLSPGLTLTIN